MEGKRPLEDTSSAHDSALSHVSSPRHFTPRLPTPDASRLSDTSSDSRSSPNIIRRGPTVSDLLGSYSSSDEHPPRSVEEKSFRLHHISHSAMPPRSPPYRVNDDQRQLLPPLKMVIANAMNSPPETPRTEEASLQPSPREPSISSTLFKPLAFYPNKKARVEDRGPVPFRQSHRPAANTSPASAYPALERTQYSQHSAFDHSMDDAANRHRRHSLHPSYGSARYEGAPGNDYRSYDSERSSWSKGYASEPSWDTVNRQSSSRDRPPMSPSSDFTFGSDGSLPARTNPFTAQGQRPSSSHHSARPYCSLLPASSTAHDRQPFGEQHRPSAGYESYERRDYEHERLSFHRRDSYEASDCRDNCHPNQQSSFFMPAHYDYAQSKTRKRSNLPKQSTEIMKTWFDNNIANPYPSEEQKARFSSLTGISMTQVSNWFINHRRRCPELREKRERARTGDMING